MGFTVSIKPVDQGFKVWTEQDEPEIDAADSVDDPSQAPPPAAIPAGPDGSPPMGDAEPSDADSDSGQTVATIKEGLTLILEALKSGGQMSDMNGQQKAFQDGFGQGAV